MSSQFNRVIYEEINKTLVKAELSAEMTQLIKLSLNTESRNTELFPWANLTLLTCESIGTVPETAMPGAIGMELFALAADIFDDIQDQDNDNVLWRRLNTAEALNLAICLLMLSYESFQNISDSLLAKEVNSIINYTGLKAIDGQYGELQCRKTEQISLDQYFKLIEQKSGSITACACKIGAILNGASNELVQQFSSFGKNLGVMWQIRNDLDDFFNFERKKDFINNTKTLPYVFLLSVLQKQPEQFKKLIKVQNNGLLGSEEREYLKGIADDEGVGHYCKVMYEIFRQKALDNITSIPVWGKGKEKLIKLVEYNV